MKTLSYFAASLALLGILLPPQLLADDFRSVANRPATELVRDVALTDTGTLKGQVLNAQGQPQAGVDVTVRQSGEVLATAQTAVDGGFDFPGMKAGVYEIISGDRADLYRVWATGTAPPAAVSSVLLVSDAGLVRAKKGGIDWQKTAMISGIIIVSGVIGGWIGYEIGKDDAS